MVSGYVTACFKDVQKGCRLEQIGCHYQVWLCRHPESDKHGCVTSESADLPKINGDLSMDIYEVFIWWLCQPQTQTGILIQQCPCCPPRLRVPTNLNSFASISAPCQMRIPSVINARTLSSWGLEKKRAFYLIRFEAIFSLCLCITCLNSCTSDPLISHGCHFGRTVHGLCNVQAILTNGILHMGEQADDPDEMFTFE